MAQETHAHDAPRRQDDRLARISHQASAAAADSLAVAGRTPSRRFDVVTTTPAASLSPCDPPQRRLDVLATNPGEICGLDRRTVVTQSLGVAALGALLGSSGCLSAGAPDEAERAPDASPDTAAGATPGIALPQGMRRIVTGNDADGQSYIVSDERVGMDGGFPNLFKTTGDDPFGPGPEPEPRTLYPTDMQQIEPEVGGANFQFVTLQPSTAESPPVWHRTETVDINVLLGGELVLVLDKEETALQPGDVVIQRNTNHAWRNPTNGPVYWAAVLVPIRQRG